jgi:MurNAc alpha-1-phosphate uridylyltransferase
MKAMILAAGAGQRMRPLTDHIPKPLLPVAGESLIDRHIRHLVAAGVEEVVINVSHLGEQIVQHCGDGSRWDIPIVYSYEEHGLETAGGIINALDLLGELPFLLVNGDVWTDYPFQKLLQGTRDIGGGAHLVFVDSPEQHSHGDFILSPNGQLSFRQPNAIGVTYAGMALMSRQFFAGVEPGKRPLRPLFDKAIEEGRLTGEHYGGEWVDVGTPERLEKLNQLISHRGD